MKVIVEKIIGKNYDVWTVEGVFDKYSDLRNFMNTHIPGEPFQRFDSKWILVQVGEYEILKQGMELFGYEEVYSERPRKELFRDSDGTIEEVV